MLSSFGQVLCLSCRGNMRLLTIETTLSDSSLLNFECTKCARPRSIETKPSHPVVTRHNNFLDRYTGRGTPHRSAL